MSYDPFAEIRCPKCEWVHFRELPCPKISARFYRVAAEIARHRRLTLEEAKARVAG